MDADDKRHLYEVNEMQEYDEAGQFKHQPLTTVKVHEQGSSKLPMYCLIGVLVVISLVLIILLGVNAVTLNQLNALPTVCNCTQQGTTGGLTSGGGGTTTNSSCDMIYNKISEVFNTTQSLLNYKDNDTLTRQMNTATLQRVNELLATKVGQILNVTQSTADDFRSFANDQATTTQNVTDTLQWVYQTTGDSAQRLINIVNTLSNIKDTGTSTAGVVDDILLVVDQLYQLQNGSTGSLLPTSCKEIKQKQPNSPSGIYLLAHPHGGSATYTYCEMGPLCNSSGPWTRVAYLDMSDATVNCPPGFRLYQTGGVRACGRHFSLGGSCASVQFPSNSLSYSQICGRVVGYQYFSTSGVDAQINNLNSYYVDGISITRGSPRQHVWTLVCGYSDSYISSVYNCPCSTGSNQQTQSFIGNNYFCEAGNSNPGVSPQLYTSDPLWDGQGCGSLETACCSAPGLPWFHRDYGNTTTTDFLELRVCADQHRYDEDIPVSFYEIYVK